MFIQQLTLRIKYWFLFVNVTRAANFILLWRGWLNRPGLVVIFTRILHSSKFASCLDTLTYLHTSGPRLVQSVFTKNTLCTDPAWPFFFSACVMVTGNWRASSTMKLFFPAISLITLRPSCWIEILASACFTCSLLPSASLFVWSPWKLQSFKRSPVIVRGRAVSVFTMPAPLWFFSFYFPIATVFIARMWQNKYRVKGKRKRRFPHTKGQ